MKFSATKIVFVITILSVITLNFTQIEVSDTLKNIAISLISFYFGQKSLWINTWKNENNSI